MLFFLLEKPFDCTHSRSQKIAGLCTILYDGWALGRKSRPYPGVNRVCLFVRPSQPAVDPNFRKSRELADSRVPIIRCFSITVGCWSVYRVVRRSQDVTEIIVLPARIPFSREGEENAKRHSRVYTMYCIIAYPWHTCVGRFVFNG